MLPVIRMPMETACQTGQRSTQIAATMKKRASAPSKPKTGIKRTLTIITARKAKGGTGLSSTLPAPRLYFPRQLRM